MGKSLHARDIKLISIGNSKGIRLPKAILQKYGFADSLVLEEREQGILLRKKETNKLSWKETYQAIAKEKEDWGDFDAILLDGLEYDELDSEKI